MSIIKCFECGREVSSSARYCPHCAYPIAEHIRNAIPEMPADLRIGGVVKGTALSVKTLCEPSIPATLMCHTHGLSITDSATEKIEQIHFAQIITLKKAYYRSLYCNQFIRIIFILHISTWNIGISGLKRKNRSRLCLQTSRAYMFVKTPFIRISLIPTKNFVARAPLRKRRIFPRRTRCVRSWRRNAAGIRRPS